MPDYDDWDNRFYQDGVVDEQFKRDLDAALQQDSYWDDPELSALDEDPDLAILDEEDF